MPLTSNQLNQLLLHLKETGSHVLASPKDADFYRSAFKKPKEKQPEKISQPVTVLPPIPQAKPKETLAPLPKPLEEEPKPVKAPQKSLPKKAPSDFVGLRNIISTVAPELNLIDEIPSDEIALKISERWKTKNQSAPISILTYQEQPEQRAFLEQITQAINVYFGPAKIVHAEKIENDKQWGAFLSVDDLKMIVVCDYTLWQLSHLLEHYKEVPQTRTRVLGKVPLFLLPDLSLYLKDPGLKRSLWNALKEKCQHL